MGGSILGTQAIYDFLKIKLIKNFHLLIILHLKIKKIKKKKFKSNCFKVRRNNRDN